MTNEKKEQTDVEIPTLSPFVVSKRRNWYSKTFMLFNILEHSKGREMVFLSDLNRKHNVRYLNAGSLNILMEYFGLTNNDEKLQGIKSKNPFNFFTDNKKNLKVYCSLATIDWKNCPIKAFNYAPSERTKQQNEFKSLIGENLKKYITDFEGAVDFDGDLDWVIVDGEEEKVELDISDENSVNRSLEDLKVIIDLFNEYHIKWRVQFSGTRGFHIFWTVPLDVSAYQKREIVNDMVKLFYTILGLKTVDKSRYNTRKVMKCSYSICTKDDVSRVVLPLTDLQIKNFVLSEMECGWVYNNVRGLKNRGLLWNNTNFNKEQSISNFMKFMDDFELKIPEHREEQHE